MTAPTRTRRPARSSPGRRGARRRRPASPRSRLTIASGPFEPGVWRQQSLGDRERLREDAEQHRLIAAAAAPGWRTSSVCTSNVTPATRAAGQRERVAEQPEQISSEPGTRNSQRGLYIRKNRSVRQPSRNVRRCGACALRPSGCSVIGTFGDRSPRRLRLDDHLGREFHPGAAQVEPVVELAA